MSDRSEPPCILFTAFEPSGDEHAAPVIRHLRATRPDVAIYALGGPKMKAAGATLIENTVNDAAMLAGALAKINEHRAIRRRIRAWLADHPVALHVPTDSPAANWGICKITKPLGAKVVHLVAPQVWAWASWRVKRLQKWSDRTLCLLPFEPAWFAKHDIDARFIGHPLFNEPLDTEALDSIAATFPDAKTKLTLLPGSRPGEIRKNWPLMRRVFTEVDGRLSGCEAVVAVGSDRQREQLMRLDPTIGGKLQIVTGQTDAAIHWADAVLTVSGTVTLHVARHAKPMAIVYRVPWLNWQLIGRWLIDTRTFTLPNLIANDGPHKDRTRHIVREFVPQLSDHATPIADEVVSLIEDDPKRAAQHEAVREALTKFDGHDAGHEAAEAILEVFDG